MSDVAIPDQVAPSWWAKVQAIPPGEAREAILERLRPRLRLRYTNLTPTPKQALFLAWQGDEAFYGGAAGPGKSTALLIAALQYVDVPGYNALLLRRTFAELEQPGALIDMSHVMLGETDAKWNQNRKRWTFPSTATLTFGYLEREQQKLRYQGPSYHFVGWDELTHFTQTMYEYLFSRQRRLAPSGHLLRALDGTSSADVPIRMRSASNPGGPGHEWVKERFVDPATRKAGVVFVPALMSENPHLDRDTYMRTLSHLRGAERLRLAAGDWDAKDDGEYFNRLSWPRYQNWNRGTRACRAWDLAGSKPTPAYPDPDYTVGLRMELDTKDGQFCVVDVERTRTSSGEVETLVHDTAVSDGRDVHIRIEQEPGSAGKALAERYRRHILRGFTVTTEQSTGAKAIRATPVSSAAEQGLVGVVGAQWNASFFAELEVFDDGSHDDQVDALSSAHAGLSRPRGMKVASQAGNQLPQRAKRA